MAKTSANKKVVNDEVATSKSASPVVENNDELVRQTFRNDLRTHFDKWLTVYDEEPTAEDIQKAKDEFDVDIKNIQTKKYTIATTRGKSYADLILAWNEKYNHWEGADWRAVIQLNKVTKVFCETLTDEDPLEVEYGNLLYLYKAMGKPSGYGLKSAQDLAVVENFDPETGEPLETDAVTYSKLLREVIARVNEITAHDHRLNLYKMRIDWMNAGVKTDFKASTIEEFMAFHEAWVALNVPQDDASLRRMVSKL